MIKKLNQKHVRDALWTLFLCTLSLFLVSCLGLDIGKTLFRPSRDHSQHRRSLVEMNLLLRLDVQNPNRFDLTLKSFEYTLYLEQ